MKNNFVILGGLLVVINSTVGLVVSGYKPFNLMLADFSILLSIAMLYVAYKISIADGFKIGYTLLFGLTGLIRFICAVSSSNEFKNNYAVLIFIILLCIEGLLIFVSHAMRNK